MREREVRLEIPEGVLAWFWLRNVDRNFLDEAAARIAGRPGRNASAGKEEKFKARGEA